jgi:hypothetical protein
LTEIDVLLDSVFDCYHDLLSDATHLYLHQRSLNTSLSGHIPLSDATWSICPSRFTQYQSFVPRLPS